MKSRLVPYILLSLGIFAGSAFGQEGEMTSSGEAEKNSSGAKFTPNPPLVLEASPRPGEIKIDGILESSWEECAAFTNFTMIRPSEDKAPLANTVGYVTFDDESIYFAFVCYDRKIDELRASLTDRDNMFQDDFVGIMIDTYRDYKTAYEFFANPYGIQGDLLFQSTGSEDASFDAVWFSDGRVYEDHWVLEMKIPFKSLRFPDRKEQTWSVHVIRTFPRDHRYQFSWMRITENNNSFLGQAGTLKFTLNQVIETRTVEVLPSVVSSQSSELVENDDEVTSRWNHANPDFDAGVGVKYGLASDMILDVAINPDFSQIESDESQISANNTFALFFTEKRPFFLEGSDIFSTNVNLLYSRSINDPLGAAKITGKAGRLTYGFTSAYDQNTPYIVPFRESSAVLATGKNSFSNFLRAKYDLKDESYIGLLASNHKLDEKGGNTMVALDGRWRIDDKHEFFVLAGMSLTSEPDDPSFDEDIQDGIVDADTTFKSGGKIRTAVFDGESYNGFIGRAVLERNSRNWEWWAVYEDYSPGFRAENGFVNSNNRRAVFPGMEYSFRFDDHPVFHEVEFGLEGWRKYDYDAVVRDTGARPFVFLGLRKQTYVFFSWFLYNREFYRGKQFDDARSWWIEVDTDIYDQLQGGFFLMVGRQINRGGEEGSFRDPFEIVPAVRFNAWSTFKPFSRLTNRLEYRSIGLWLDWGGDLITSQKIVRNSLTYQFTKRLFLRLIGEYIIEDYWDSGEGSVVNEQSFSLDPLLSYKINPFTVFFVGANLGGEKNPFPDRDGLTPTSQLFFLKFQYFMRI